jgi:hypothetical protein
MSLLDRARRNFVLNLPHTEQVKVLFDEIKSHIIEDASPYLQIIYETGTYNLPTLWYVVGLLENKKQTMHLSEFITFLSSCIDKIQKESSRMGPYFFARDTCKSVSYPCLKP